MPFTNTEINEAEMAFINDMAGKLPDVPNDDAQPAPAAAATDAPVIPESDDAADEGDAERDAQDPKTPKDTPAANPDAPADAPESEDDDEDEDDDGAEPAEKPSREFTDALKREGVKLSLDDVPAEARPFVQQRLKEIETGFTRARQRDTADLVALRAEQRFIRDNPVDFIVAQIHASAELAEKVNAKLDALEGNAEAAKDHATAIEHRRAQARTAEESTVRDAEQTQRAIEALDTHLDASLAKAGIKPGKALERMIAAAMDIAEARTGKRLISTADVDEIVADYAADVQEKNAHARRLEKRRTRAQYVDEKVTDRKTAGLPVRPGTGGIAAPGPEPRAANDEEFTARYAARL